MRAWPRVLRAAVFSGEDGSRNVVSEIRMAYPTFLNEIGKKFGTDKSSDHHDYLSFYEERLAHLRTETFTLYEIGVLRGESLKTWGEYFPAASIVGLDVTPDAVQYAGDNRHVHIGDASCGEVIADVVSTYGPPLIVIDDGSHIWHQQIASLRYLWPSILGGGMFIMEDLHTSFDGLATPDPAWRGISPISTYDYVLELNKHVVGRGYMGDTLPYDHFVRDYWSTIRSIEWYSRTCIIRKKA